MLAASIRQQCTAADPQAALPQDRPSMGPLAPAGPPRPLRQPHRPLQRAAMSCTAIALSASTVASPMPPPRTPAPPGAPIPFCPFKAAPGFERHAVPIKPFPWFAEPAGASSAARLANRFAPWAWLAPAQPPSLPGRSPAPCSHAWWQARFGWPAEPSTLQHTRCSRAELTELRRCPRAARSS